MAQSVPSASLLPCVESRLPGWTVANVAVNDGRSVITLDHDRRRRRGRHAHGGRPPGRRRREDASSEPGVRRVVRVEHLAGAFTATWHDECPGGCVTYRLHSTTDPMGQFATRRRRCWGSPPARAAPVLSQRSGGRLQMDPQDSTMNRPGVVAGPGQTKVIRWTISSHPPPSPRSRHPPDHPGRVSFLTLVVLFYYLLKDVDLAQVWAEIQAMTWMEDTALAAIAAWNLATYGLVWMSVTPGLGFGRAMVMTGSSQRGDQHRAHRRGRPSGSA